LGEGIFLAWLAGAVNFSLLNVVVDKYLPRKSRYLAGMLMEAAFLAKRPSNEPSISMSTSRVELDSSFTLVALKKL
jgi:hypothetical protein